VPKKVPHGSHKGPTGGSHITRRKASTATEEGFLSPLAVRYVPVSKRVAIERRNTERRFWTKPSTMPFGEQKIT
jgi:hypothetical protein